MMKTILLPALPVASPTLTGCVVGWSWPHGATSSAQPTPPPAAELREGISHVAIVTFSDSSRVRMDVPNSKADIAAEPSVFSNLARSSENTRAVGLASRQQAMDAADAAPFPMIAGKLDLLREPGPFIPSGELHGLSFDPPWMGGAAIFPEIRRVHGLVVAGHPRRMGVSAATRW